MSDELETSGQGPDGALTLSEAQRAIQALQEQNAALHRQQADRDDSLEALRLQRDLSLALNATADLGQALVLMLDTVLRFESLDCGGVYLANPESGALDLVAQRGLSPEFVAAASHYSAGSPHVRMATLGEAHYGNYVDIRPTINEQNEREGLRALALIPVVHQGQLLAVMNLASHTSDTIPAATRMAAETLALQVGSALLRLRTDEALRHSETLYHAIFDQSPIGIEIYDAAGRLLRVNPACLELFGVVDGRELEGFNLFEDPNLGEVYKERLRLGQTVRYEVAFDFDKVRASALYQTARTGIAWLDVLITPLGAQPGGYLVQIQDISQRKQAEDMLLRQAGELARSNLDLEHFAYVVSHDLQEPLRMVTGYLGLLRQKHPELLAGEAGEFVAVAVKSAARLQEMIRALLDLSRVKARRRPLLPVDLEELLARVLDGLQLAIIDSRAVVTHDPLPTLPADEAQLAQVLQNLIANAVKFRRPGVPPRVHLAAERQESSWRFSVRDNGIGLDREQAGRLFQIFARLHTQDEYAGLGLGLALCRSIVERHGGQIWVESEPGQGTTFYFTLPA